MSSVKLVTFAVIAFEGHFGLEASRPYILSSVYFRGTAVVSHLDLCPHVLHINPFATSLVIGGIGRPGHAFVQLSEAFRNKRG